LIFISLFRFKKDKEKRLCRHQLKKWQKLGRTFIQMILFCLLLMLLIQMELFTG